MKRETRKFKKTADSRSKTAAMLFTRLFEENKKQLFGTAYYILGSREDAEEAVQTAFIRLWENFDRVPEIENISIWLKKITVNICIDRVRTSQRKKRKPVFDLQHDFPECTESPLAELLKTEELKKILKAIDHLSPRERAAFLLFTTGGLSAEEIAAQLGTAPSTVRNQIMNARKKIKKKLSRPDE